MYVEEREKIVKEKQDYDKKMAKIREEHYRKMKNKNQHGSNI